MGQLVASINELYTPIYDEFMWESFKEYSQVHTKLSKTVFDKTLEYKVDDLGGFGEWEDADEASDGGYEDPVVGYAKTYTQAKVWKKFWVSFEAVLHDEYALLKKAGTAQSLGKGGRARVERDMAGVLINGFSATTNSPDGQILFSANHPKNNEETGTTYDNLLSGAFSHDNLEAAEAEIVANFYDMAGIPIEPEENPVIAYPPALRGIVERTLADRAGERPGTANRDINRFAGRYNPVEWVYLGAAQGGSDAAWYILYPSLGYYKIIWSLKPQFTTWIDNEAQKYHFCGYMLYAYGADNWRMGFGSTGA